MGARRRAWPSGVAGRRRRVAYLANGAFSDWSAEAFAVDVATGDVRWRTDLGAGELRLRGSVAVDDGTVFVVDGDLVALDAADGSETWRTAFDAPAETTPSVAHGTAYVTDAAGTLHAVAGTEPSGGRRTWASRTGGRLSPSPPTRCTSEPTRGSAR